MGSYFDVDITGTIQYPFCTKWCPGNNICRYCKSKKFDTSHYSVDGTIGVMTSTVLHILNPQFLEEKLHSRSWVNLETLRVAFKAPSKKDSIISLKKWLAQSQSTDVPYGAACFKAIEWSSLHVPQTGLYLLAVLLSDGGLLLTEVSSKSLVI